MVKTNISYRIRKLRESKDYSQENIAGELNITASAYSKIERGITDPSIGRLAQIAKILGVDITYFFESPAATEEKVKEKSKTYGFASKSDIEELVEIIRQIKEEIAVLKKEVTAKNDASSRKKKSV